MLRSNQKIKFIPNKKINSMFYPKPASSFIPDWYKDTETYLTESNNEANSISRDFSTIKRCPPIFDSITSGYIIVTPSDLMIKRQDGAPYYIWLEDLIDFHPADQALLHPYKVIKDDGNIADYPKIMNPWHVQTPKGYSSLFIPPMHRQNIISILPGVVDTDIFKLTVNFPFVLSNPEFEGVIPAGTPIAQVIPFKRDEWKMSVDEDPDMNEIKDQYSLFDSKFLNVYRTFFWQKKKYK